MKRRVLASLFALILVATIPPVAFMQTSNSGQPATNTTTPDWQGLRDLKPGKKIVVEFKSGIGDPVTGKFVSAIGSRLTVIRDGYTLSLKQEDIQSVYRHDKWSRNKLSNIGTGLGMFVGAFIGAGIMIRHEQTEGYVPAEANPFPIIAGAALGGLAGAGVGRLISAKRKAKLLYAAK